MRGKSSTRCVLRPRALQAPHAFFQLRLRRKREAQAQRQGSRRAIGAEQLTGIEADALLERHLEQGDVVELVVGLAPDGEATFGKREAERRQVPRQRISEALGAAT